MPLMVNNWIIMNQIYKTYKHVAFATLFHVQYSQLNTLLNVQRVEYYNEKIERKKRHQTTNIWQKQLWSKHCKEAFTRSKSQITNVSLTARNWKWINKFRACFYNFGSENPFPEFLVRMEREIKRSSDIKKEWTELERILFCKVIENKFVSSRFHRLPGVNYIWLLYSFSHCI